MKVLVIDDRATDTIIAALRGWQNRLQGIIGDDDPLIEVAENGREGDSAMLSVDEIDDLIEERINTHADRIHALVVGDPFEGMQMLGPFETDEEASQIGETQYRDQPWRVVELRPTQTDDDDKSWMNPNELQPA